MTGDSIFFCRSYHPTYDSYQLSTQRAKRNEEEKYETSWKVNIFLTRIFHFPLKNNAVNRRRK